LNTLSRFNSLTMPTSASNMSRTSFHALRVQSISPETSEAVVVTLDVPENLRETFAFIQGQYLTLRQTIDGQDLRRSYSICAGVDEGKLRVGVRHVPGGVFSTWMNQSLRVGDTLQVMPPQGRFYAPLEPTQSRHHVGIAGGSGITPVLSILRTVLAREPLSRCTLIYGNRQLRSTMFKEALEDLKNQYLQRLALHYVFSDEPTDVDLSSGVLNREKIAAFLASVVPADSIDAVYVCGPYQMNDEAEWALREAGVAQERIHIERFGVAPTSVSAQREKLSRHDTQPHAVNAAQVVLVRDGMRHVLDYSAEQASVLDCASAAGLDVPFSCTSGVCGTCRAKVIEGEMRMTRNFALSDAEVAAGFVLACQAQPISARVVLSYDER
jgi:ring-1,2-phenylacetyl-CoA epoxidase subunit PaaE